MSNSRNWFVAAVTTIMLSACKVSIEVPTGGSVSSASGAYDCPENTVCVIDVVDLFFDETFTAVPAEGYQFTEWKKRDRGFFAFETNPSVRLYTSDLEGIPALAAFLETDDVFYLEPSFQLIPKPEDSFTLTGTWNYTQREGSCTASGQFFQEVVPGEGVYQTLTEDSVQVQRRGDECSYVYAADFPPESRKLGPIDTVLEDGLNRAELDAAYEAFFGLTLDFLVITPNHYRIETPELDSSWNYTRVE